MNEEVRTQPVIVAEPIFWIEFFFFLSAICVLHGQVRAIIEEAASLTRC